MVLASSQTTPALLRILLLVLQNIKDRHLGKTVEQLHGCLADTRRILIFIVNQLPAINPPYSKWQIRHSFLQKQAKHTTVKELYHL